MTLLVELFSVFPTIEFMTIQPPLADLEVMQDIVAKS